MVEIKATKIIKELKLEELTKEEKAKLICTKNLEKLGVKNDRSNN